MDVCILDASGQVLVHRNVKSTPEAFLESVAPYREDLVVAAECMFTWYWLADVCAAEGIAFVLGHALGNPQAITATARKLAVLVYPALKGDLLYRDVGADGYNSQQRARLLRRLRQGAATLGLELIDRQTGEVLASAGS